MDLQRQRPPLLIIHHLHQTDHIVNNTRRKHIKHVKRIDSPRYVDVLFLRFSIQLFSEALAQLKHEFEDRRDIHRQIQFERAQAVGILLID